MMCNQSIFSNMRYCPETVIVQSSLFLAEKHAHLNGKKVDVFHGKEVKIVKDAIEEVSQGLCIHGEEGYELLSKEKQALHYKLHFWLYKTWCQVLDSNDLDVEADLDGFPPLPSFGTGFFISIVQHMEWEQLLVECLVDSPNDLPLASKLREITAAILDSPTTKDTELFALMFNNLLHLESYEADPEFPSSSEILITTLASLCKHIHNQNTQVCLLKRTIEYLFQHFFNTRPASLSEDKKSPLSGLAFSSINPLESEISERKDANSMIQVAEVLAMLFTEQWAEVSHWTFQDSGNIGKMDISMWYPMHHWILALYVVLALIMKDNECNEKLNLFQHELGKYVDTFASITEKDWVSQGLEGTSIEWNCYNTTIEECFDPNGCQEVMFSSESIQDTLETAVWRVNNNLPGSKDCFKWLLSAEEVFDDPIWLECITKNASSNAGKEELVMMIDIICVQRQMMETFPDMGSEVFAAIKKVILDVFKELPSLHQDDILKYTFSMSIMSGLDIKNNSILFNPSHNEDNKKAFSQQLQAVFNKLVDDSQAVSFQRALNDIKKMALVIPYMVMYKVLNEAVKYGHSNKVIYEILQEIPVLCSLSTSDSCPKVLFETLSFLMASVKTKQEEKNLVKLVQSLLQPYKKDRLLAPNEPLANITELVQSCVIPHMRFKDDIPLMKVSLKVLKSALTVLDHKKQENKAFILKYLIPIVLTLAKHLYACKVSWESMSPQITISLSFSEVRYFRGHVLEVLGVSCDVIVKCFQGHIGEIAGPLDWLLKKVKDLDWLTALHFKQLQDILPVKRPCYLPSCLLEICEVKEECWKFFEMENCDFLLVLFQCCSVSDSILDEIVNALKKESMGGMTRSFNDELAKNLCKVMPYFSTTELSRVIAICKQLITRCAQVQKREVEGPIVVNEAIYANKSLRTTYLLSSVLHQVFKIVSQPCCSCWASPAILGNMIKHYVNAIKGLYQELITGDLSDKVAVDDVIACIFTDICHVICLVPSDVTDPLFILVLDVASSVSERHADDLKNCVAMVPNSVYTESLIQKLSGT